MATAIQHLIGVSDNGELTYIEHNDLDFLAELGSTETKRASHVEPDSFTLRVVFHFLRSKFGEHGKIAQWTRNWKCLWRVNMRPSGGPVLDGRWLARDAALAAEIRWLATYKI